MENYKTPHWLIAWLCERFGDFVVYGSFDANSSTVLGHSFLLNPKRDFVSLAADLCVKHAMLGRRSCLISPASLSSLRWIESRDWSITIIPPRRIQSLELASSRHDTMIQVFGLGISGIVNWSPEDFEIHEKAGEK